MLTYFKITKEDVNFFVAAIAICAMAFSGIYTQYAVAETESLTVTVVASSEFSVDTNNFLGDLTPGTPKFATSTLSVTTNTASGWYVELYGEDRTTGNTTMDLTTNAAVGITDDTEWIPGAATTTAGNATSLTSGDDMLSFRVMSASGTPRFLSTNWWGANDTTFTNALWAGFASTTAANKKIGQISSGDYNASAAINTVQYYLDVPIGQQLGAYSGNLIYTLVTP